MIIISVVLWILLFMFLVIIHELGHFTAAKKLWVKVLEFGLWIPPKAKKFRKDKSWTEYTLNRLPFGGFVNLKWDNPENEKDFNASDSFMSAKLRKKVIILLGGIFMNFLFAWIVIAWLYSVWTKPFIIVPENQWISFKIQKNLVDNSLIITNYTNLSKNWFITKENPIVVNAVISWGLAYNLLNTWDIIISVNWEKVLSSTFQKKLSDNFWKKIQIWFTRWEDSKNIEIQCPENNCILWILTQWPEVSVKLPILSAMGKSLQEISLQVTSTFKIIWDLWKNIISFKWKELKQQVKWFSGPVWIIKIFSDIFRTFNRHALIMLSALISIALWAFNLLPIPALDGGRLLWVLIQKIFFLPKEKYFEIEWYINTFFFILLMILGIFIVIKDLNMFWHIWF